MRQRGFTLLEMMLILLLMGVSAGMVMLAFPTSREDDAAQTLARFQTQLRFIRERGLQTGQFLWHLDSPRSLAVYAAATAR